jgi:uncharacterized protein (TIGR03083 family)
MASQPDPRTDVPTLFDAERARLLEMLAGLSDDDWHRPTPCPAWTVLGLCTHLVGDDFSLLARHRDDHLGTPAPDGLTDDGFIEWLDDLQVEWVRAARRLSPRLVVDLLAWTRPQLVDTLRRQDPHRVTARVSWAGPDMVPVWLDQVRELSEQWIHRQQLRQALGRPTDLNRDALATILEGFRHAYPFRLGAVDADPGDSVVIDVTGPVPATWVVVATPHGWIVGDEPGGPVVARLSMSTEQAWRLLTNNLSREQQRRLAVEGDPTIVEVLLRTRAIIGSPT